MQTAPRQSTDNPHGKQGQMKSLPMVETPMFSRNPLFLWVSAVSFDPTSLSCFDVSFNYLLAHKSKANAAADAARHCQSSSRLNAHEFTGLCTERDIHNLRLILWELFRVSECVPSASRSISVCWPFWSHKCESHSPPPRLQITSPVFSIKFSETSTYLFMRPGEGT